MPPSKKAVCRAESRPIATPIMSDVRATVPVVEGNVKVAAPFVIEEITGEVKVLFVRV